MPNLFHVLGILFFLRFMYLFIHSFRSSLETLISRHMETIGRMIEE